MNIKRIFIILQFVFIISALAFSQGSDTMTIARYTATVDNEFAVPFFIANASDPTPETPIIRSLAGKSPDEIKFDNQRINPLQNKESLESQDQNFEFIFVPKDTGDYEITLRGRDKKRNDRFSVGETRVFLNVVLPVFADVAKKPPATICEREAKMVNFIVKGLNNTSEYKVVLKNFNGKDSIVYYGNVINLKKEELKSGAILDATVYYKNRTFSFYDGTKMNESVFKIPIIKRKAQVYFPTAKNAELLASQGIPFIAKKFCTDFSGGEAVLDNEIEEVSVKNTDNDMNVFGDYRYNGEGGYTITIKPGLSIPRDGMQVRVTVKVSGTAIPYETSYTLLKK